jgi:tetratricopeptide (TPR) repeat protein
MKKTLIILLLFLAGTFIVLSIADQSDYKVEKKLWVLQKQFEKIKHAPQNVPQQRYDDFIQNHHNIITHHPKSRLIPRVYLRIGSIYELKKDYAKARGSYGEILKQFPAEREFATEALMRIGQTYEREGRQDQAVNTYQWILANYPLTTTALNIPLYLAQYFQSLKEEGRAQEQLREAVAFYQKVIQEEPNSLLEFRALRLLATVYLAQSRWQEAIQVMGDMLLRYHSADYLNTQRARLLIKSMNTIAVTELKDCVLPIAIYQRFLKENPQHTLSDNLKEVIKALEDFQAKPVLTKNANSGK